MIKKKNLKARSIKNLVMNQGILFILLLHFLSTLNSRYILAHFKINVLYQQLSNCDFGDTLKYSAKPRQ